jgi:hypothetical protein
VCARVEKKGTHARVRDGEERAGEGLRDRETVTQRDTVSESQRDIERREFEMWPYIVKFVCKQRTY